jgi:ectoine hydroxylase-related dioxygenase (phytanoyl-CoA dioxygenase family)
MSDPSLDELAFQMQVTGFCIIRDLIPADRCAAIRETVIKAVRDECAASEVGRSAAERGVGFTPGIINHDQSFAEYLAEERLLQPVERMLGEHVRISFTSAIINQPGNQRGIWHADWPFNQTRAGRVRAPYPDALMHITTLWMLSPFEAENGGTLIVPGSHRSPTNPTAEDGPDAYAPFPGETHASGPAGSVLVFDSRLWHASAPNRSNEPRVALAVRYAPWWLDLEVLRPESDQRKRMVDETGAKENAVPSVRREVFDRLPERVKPLFRHWVEPSSG